MLANAAGNAIITEQAIFPLVSLDPKHSTFKCLGTAFFINPVGWFITAKHVICNNNKLASQTMMGVQTLSTDNPVIRHITHLSIHPIADIAVGKRGIAVDKNARQVNFESAPYFTLRMSKLIAQDRIIAFGYPRTTKNVLGSLTTFHFRGTWSHGHVVDFHAEGSPIVRNRCYQTTMQIDSGSSGGPVFKDNMVVGINSSGMDIEKGEIPISFITPIDYIKDLLFYNTKTENLTFEDLLARKLLRAID